MPAVQTANPPGFESVWALLQEIGEKQKELTESQKETDRLIKELRESQKEHAESANNRIGSLTNLLEKMHKYAHLHGDKRIFLGAVAGIVITDEIKKYALEKGFYFIEYAGENFYITSPSGNPKEW